MNMFDNGNLWVALNKLVTLQKKGMDVRKFLEKVNGKKKHAIIPTALVISIVGAVFGYGKMDERVDNVVKEVESIHPLQEQVARIDERVKGIDDKIVRGEERQEKVNDRMFNKLDQIMGALR